MPAFNTLQIVTLGLSLASWSCSGESGEQDPPEESESALLYEGPSSCGGGCPSGAPNIPPPPLSPGWGQAPAVPSPSGGGGTVSPDPYARKPTKCECSCWKSCGAKECNFDPDKAGGFCYGDCMQRKCVGRPDEE